VTRARSGYPSSEIHHPTSNVYSRASHQKLLTFDQISANIMLHLHSHLWGLIVIMQSMMGGDPMFFVSMGSCAIEWVTCFHWTVLSHLYMLSYICMIHRLLLMNACNAIATSHDAPWSGCKLSCSKTIGMLWLFDMPMRSLPKSPMTHSSQSVFLLTRVVIIVDTICQLPVKLQLLFLKRHLKLRNLKTSSYIGVLAPSNASVTCTAHMPVFTMSFSSLMVKMAGTVSCGCTSLTNSSPIALAKFNMVPSGYFPIKMSSPPYFEVLLFCSNILLIFLYLLIRTV
jgi:hypothetical protein